MSQINVEKSIFGYFDTDVIFKRIWNFFVENFGRQNVFIWPISYCYIIFCYLREYLIDRLQYIINCIWGSVFLRVGLNGSKTPTLSTTRRGQI